MMPAVPVGAGVGIPGAGIPGAKAAGRVVDGGKSVNGSGAGSEAGDGFGPVIQAAMASGSPRAQAGARKPVPAGSESAGKSAKPDAVRSLLAKGMADAPTPKNVEAAAAAGEKPAVLADAMTEAEKNPEVPGLVRTSAQVPGQVSARVPAQGDTGGAGVAAPVTNSRMARDSQGAARQVAAGAGRLESAVKDGAANGAVQGELAKLTTAAAEKVSILVTQSHGGMGSVAATVDRACRDAAGSPFVTTGGKADGKSGAKTDTKKNAGKQQSKGLVTGRATQVVQPGLMAAAQAASVGVVQAHAAASRSRTPGQNSGRVGGSVEGGGGVAVVSGRGVAAAMGHTAGKSATSAAVVAPQGAQGRSAGLAVGDAGANGMGTANHAANVTTGVMTGPVTAGSVAGSGAANTSGAGSDGHSGAGQDARVLPAQTGMGVAGPHGQTGATKDGPARGPATGSASTVGFTASLLQGHPGTGMGTAATAHNGVQHAMGTAGGAWNANPYTRMDETQGHALVYAAPQKMSVAVTDPSLGSFQVRAQSAGAQVAASLATASAATHAQLSGHLPSLTAFLQDQRVDLTRVTVVQQSLLGGDAGPRDFGGQQRQSRSGGRGARSQAARVGAVKVADASTGPAEVSAAPAVQGSLRRGMAGGGVDSIDLMA